MDVLQSKEEIIANFQLHLKLIRQAINWDQGELGELIGVSRQTINNIENFRTPLNTTQYVALAAVIDKKINDKPALRNLIDTILAMEVDEEIAVLWQKLNKESLPANEIVLGTAGSTAATAAALATLGGGSLAALGGGFLGVWLATKAVKKLKKKCNTDTNLNTL